MNPKMPLWGLKWPYLTYGPLLFLCVTNDYWVFWFHTWRCFNDSLLKKVVSVWWWWHCIYSLKIQVQESYNVSTFDYFIFPFTSIHMIHNWNLIMRLCDNSLRGEDLRLVDGWDRDVHHTHQSTRDLSTLHIHKYVHPSASMTLSVTCLHLWPQH